MGIRDKPKDKQTVCTMPFCRLKGVVYWNKRNCDACGCAMEEA